MKNACIVWKNRIQGEYEQQSSRVLDAFFEAGYTFDEYRVLLYTDENTLIGAVKSLKSTHENVVVISEFEAMKRAKTALGTIFKEDAFQGTASGVGTFTDERYTVFLLAYDEEQWGVTYVREFALPYLEKKYNASMQRTVIRSIGANAQHVSNLLAQIQAMGQGMIRCTDVRKYGEDVISIFFNENISKRLADEAVRVLVEGLGESVYAVDDVSIEEQLVRLLQVRGKKISVAESFTGGGVARKLVSVSGVSSVYFEGLNTYDELSKIKRLGVTEYTLNSYGAVSDQTAYEMAMGLMATGNCDISIATTGLAGPNTDRSMLPVGLSYIAVGTREKIFVYRYKFEGTREEIMETAIQHALFLAYKQLKNM